ncbi:tubulin-binding protein [Vespertiliibacter pulmonis]|uniref:Autotransporter secretion inner membrane protein TamB n=1 Tax=Vespertiliibacter pulmonis TaxID=1443036 RepID=A0A3N4WKY1_9PAST|nr:translocation/assembly module TamB domain-containing protein [Vespertiliibacter pulmonis]QLB21383.1 tubulin-binding protein [Vespertiliibacter pulmonis]RPE85794.1 autotransporter secretion inner membrane protein TamB [Vespertiliibacter pulmonis]
MTESQTEQSNQPTKKRSKWRYFWWFLCLLFGLLIAIIAFLATGNGQRLALQWLAKSMDSLSISQIDGSLQDGLRLSDTHFNMEGVDVAVKQADLHIGFDCLLDKTLCLNNIALKDATISVDTTKFPPSEPKSDSSDDVQLPLPVSLKNLALDNINVNVDGVAVKLDHFQSGLVGEKNNIQLLPTTLDGLQVILPLSQADSSEQKIAKQPENSESKPAIDWEALKQQLSEPLLTKLDPIKLPVNLNIDDFNAKNIQIAQQIRESEKSDQDEAVSTQSLVNISSVNLALKSDEKSLALSNLDIQTDKGNISGKGSLNLIDNYPLNWQLKADTPELKELKLPANQVDLTISGELFGKTVLNVNTRGAVNAQIEGSVQLSAPKTPLDLTIKSDQIKYPFIAEKGQDPLVLKDVDLKLSGDLLNYQLDSHLAISGMGMPNGDLQLNGKGGLTQFELEKLSLNILQGQANLVGKVDWSNGIEWTSNAHLAGINTRSLLPEWAAMLSGDMKTTGYAGRGKQGDEWGVAVSEIDLSGVLLNKPLQLKGELTADSNTLLSVPNANLIYGENKIGLKGVLGDKSDFLLDIKAPNLQGLVPNLKASVNGLVHLQGKITEPFLDLDLVANNVSYEQTSLKQLTAKGKITTEKTIQGNIDLALSQLSHGDIKLAMANLQLSGSETNHSLKLVSKGDPIGANLQISGKFDRLQQIWQGQLSNVLIQSPQPLIGEWKNDKPIQISYRNKQVQANISSHCWHNPKLNLCFPTTFNAGLEGKVPFEIKSFDLITLQELLDKESQISGIVSAKGDIAWFENKSPILNLDLASNGVKFIQKNGGRNFPISLSPLTLKANLVDNNLKLKTDIRVENNGRVVSDLMMKDIMNTRALSGSLNIEQINLSLIKPLLTNGESVDGNLNARLTLGGNALSPLLFGNLQLSGLKAHSNAMPFDVTGGNLTANFNGVSSTLKGNIQTKESNLVLEGDANWKRLDAWHTRISAKANRFRVNIPSIAKVDISPNIEVKATPKELVLSGNIDVPWARISVEELPESAVSVSADEVIMDGTAKDKQVTLPLKNLPQDGKGMAIKANITVNIGQDPKEAVKIDAYGFKSDLKGILKVRQGSKGLGLYGQVNVLNGTFASFGQDLVVRKGVISFTGMPSQPTLDIEAIRNPEAMEDQNVVAGVKITGIADSPDVKVFSSPSMSQDQALSYILTGRSLENSGDAGSSNSIAAALIGMSLSKSSKLVGGVGSAFGISDLNVTTAGIGDNTKVVVSGSLTPKFKVKYGVGIFAPLTELTLRYRLAPSLYLQWISSINQAVDLLYRFEFD